MSNKGSRFRQVVAMAKQLVTNAHKRGDVAAAREAAVIARVAANLASAERSFESQANDLISALARVGKSLKQQGESSLSGAATSGSAYFVSIAGSRQSSGDARHKGLVGKRIGRGPVSVSPGKSTKAITAAFAKILEAQAQLSQIKAEVERLKHRR
jgi:hypothetical protein